MVRGSYLSRAATALALFAAFPASAQSLKEALASAYRSNPTVEAARANYRATEELKAQAISNVLPQIAADGSASKVENTQTRNPSVFGPGGATTTNIEPLTAGIDGAVPVFTGFRNYNAIRQARARVRAGEAELISIEQSLLRDAAAAYFDVLRDETIYESSLNNVEVLTRQKREADLRFEVGEVTKTDVAQADARLAQARSQLASAQAQLAVARARFRELIGDAPTNLEKAPVMPALPETLEAALALADEFAPGNIGARAQELARRRGVQIAKGAFLPTVSLVAGYSYAEEPSTFINSDEQFSYGVRASVPIFNGGLNLSRVREARALHESSEASVEEAERRIIAAVTSAFEQLVASRIAINSAKAQVAANELALTGVRREAQLGTRSTLDVLNAEQEFFNSKVALANAEREERVASFALLAAAGILNPEAVGIAEPGTEAAANVAPPVAAGGPIGEPADAGGR
ncbi:MAG: TolC family outer membrane protein [Parvularculaceae bacterium]|nr:TolC family outer membrane protein [Parvularculaceae bacterium]